MAVNWSEQDLRKAQKALEKNTTVSAACAQLSKDLKRNVDLSNLRAVFRRNNLPDPKEFVSASPVLRRASEDKAAKLKREHKDLVEAVKEHEAREKAWFAMKEQSPIYVPRREFSSGLREGTFCALLSDLHVEETVEPDDSTFHNAYSLEIADLRINRFFDGMKWMIEYKRPVFQIRDVVLWLGGDLKTGHIHEENIETTELAPIETLLWLKPRLIAHIKSLLLDDKIDTLYIVCSYGNHGRNSKKPMRARGAAHSYEWLLYKIIESEFADEPRVRFITNPKGHQYLGVYDWMTHWHHGDETRFQGGVGGIMIPLNKAIARWNEVKYAHLHNIGHYHQYLQTRYLTANGSGIGYNDYAMSIGATPEPAQQACYIIDSKRCKTEKSPLWLEDRSGENALRIARGWMPWPEAA